jgi:hypothetical protein
MRGDAASDLRSVAYRSLALMLFGLAALAFVGGGSADARQSSRRACGSIRIDYRPTPSEHYKRMYVSAPRRIRCSHARQVMRRYWHDPGPCSGSSCFRWYRDGWQCDSATPGDWPVIAECLKGGSRLLGRVHSSVTGPR